MTRRRGRYNNGGNGVPNWFMPRNRPVRRKAPVDLRATAATRGYCPPDPVAVNSTIKTNHIIQISETGTAVSTSITNGTLFSNTPGAAGWQSFRIRKIQVWGSDAGGNNGSLPALAIQIPGGSTSAGMSFSDLGTAGSRRPAISIMPDAQYREVWHPMVSGGTQVLFNILCDAPYIFVVNVTLELVSATVTLPNLFKSLKV